MEQRGTSSRRVPSDPSVTGECIPGSSLFMFLCHLYPDYFIRSTSPHRLGPAGNFISGPLYKRLGLRKTPSPNPYSVYIITGNPLMKRLVRYVTSPVQLGVGLLHKEEIQFLLLENSTVEIILGWPWLVLHSPTLCWETGDGTQWGQKCFFRCLPVAFPHHTTVPARIPMHVTTIESPTNQICHEVPHGITTSVSFLSPACITPSTTPTWRMFHGPVAW